MIKSLIKNQKECSTPTEVQMKLAISQVLSLPSFYNEPVIVLSFDISEEDVVTGRFRDVARPRVFTFKIDTNDESVSFNPYFYSRNDSLEVDIRLWEEFSIGYSFRLDDTDKISSSIKRKQCTKPTAYNCGRSCINVHKTCRVVAKDAISKSRIKKLKALGVDYRTALGRPKVKKPPTEGGGGGGVINPEKEPQKPTPENNIEVKDEVRDRVKETNEQRKERLSKESQKVRLDLWALKNDFLNEHGNSGQTLTSEADPEQIIKNTLNQLEKRIGATTFDSVIDETNTLINRTKDLDAKVSEYLGKARNLTYVKNSTPIKPKITTTNDDIKKASQEGSELLSKMVDIPKLSKTSIKITGTPGGATRSYYLNGNNTVYMGKPDKAVVVHELGHWIEDNVPSLAKEVKEFYNKRTEGEATRRLKDVVPKAKYKNNEITRVDKWLSPYMGKVYPTGSEVLSMGLEMMHRNPVYFAEKDPEMFDFIYSVVRRGKE